MATAFEGTSSKQTTVTEDVLDYNDAFPQLTSAVHGDGLRANTLFSSRHTSATNGSNAVGSMASTTNTMYAGNNNEEERRRKFVAHASAMTTKIVSF